jgi:hypothetical protein
MNEYGKQRQGMKEIKTETYKLIKGMKMRGQKEPINKSDIFSFF